MVMNRSWILLGACVVASAFGSQVVAEMLPSVQFSQSSYIIPTATSRFQVDVVIDADRTRPGLQPLPAGLTSFGLSLVFNPLEGRVLATTDLAVVAAMDFGAFGGPAEKYITLTTASAKAFVPLTDPAYGGSSLMSFFVTGVSSQPYTISLGLFQQGPGDAAFVDGDGIELDGLLTFGSARVSVIPEPVTPFVVLCVAPLVARRRR